jgi:hypothetical protein
MVISAWTESCLALTQRLGGRRPTAEGVQDRHFQALSRDTGPVGRENTTEPEFAR